MQNHKSIKRAKLILIALIAAVITVCLIRQPAGASSAQDTPRKRVEIVAQGTPLAERFGPDDGMAFAIHFSGDIHGSLEPCG